MEREEGFYWVKFIGGWVVARWLPRMGWFLTGHVSAYDDTLLDGIGPRIYPPDQPSTVESSSSI